MPEKELNSNLRAIPSTFEDNVSDPVVSTMLETIKDAIGKIGIEIGNVERCLSGVEDCYTKTVELLSDAIKKGKQ